RLRWPEGKANPAWAATAGKAPQLTTPIVNNSAEPTSGVSHWVANHRHPAVASNDPKAAPDRRRAAAAPMPTAVNPAPTSRTTVATPAPAPSATAIAPR